MKVKKNALRISVFFIQQQTFIIYINLLSLGEGIRPIQQRGTGGGCGTPSIRQGPGPCFRVQSIEVILKVLLDMSDPVWCLRIWSSELIVTYVKVYEYYHFLKDIFGLSIISSVTNATDQSKIKSGSFCPYRYVGFRKRLKSKQKNILKLWQWKASKFLIHYWGKLCIHCMGIIFYLHYFI